MTPTAGSVSGTRWVVLRGGPPEWDGHSTAIANHNGPAPVALTSLFDRPPEDAPRRLQRWCHTSDLTALWERTDFETEVEVPRHTREGGTKIVTAEVWVFVGYKGEPEEQLN